MTAPQPIRNKQDAHRAVEISIHLGLTALLAAACLVILLPFVPLIMWGIIIAVAAYPTFERLRARVGGRAGVAATILTALLLALLIVPAVLLTGSLVGGIENVIAHVKSGSAIIPPPLASIDKWPVIGAPLKNVWVLASRDIVDVLRRFSPQIKAVLPGVLSGSAAVGMTILQLLLSIVLSGAILANAQAAYEVTRSLANRLFGERGPEFQQLIGATVRSVTFGILGVALIQAVFATLGFLVVGLSPVGLWAAAFLFAAIVQVGVIVLIPAVIYVFAVASTAKAVIFLVWCIIVGLMDNVLKPLLLGRGVAVPILVVFLGSIGGFIVMGIIGLFVGAIVLSVGYKLFLAWLEETDVPEPLP